MRLRSNVEILESEQGPTLVDHATGLQLSLSREISTLLSRLCADTARALEHPQAAQLTSFIDSLGLTWDARLEQARERQARYILADAEESERERVRATVLRAYAQTALHREHLHDALHEHDAWELSELPLLGKDSLRRHFPRGLTVDSLALGPALRKQDLIIASTSGTTGERLQAYSDTRVERLPEAVLRLWGIEPTALARPLRTAVLTSPGCAAGVCTRGASSYEARLSFEHTLFLESARDPFDLTPEQVVAMLGELARFEPDLWLVNPTYLALFTRCAERAGLPLPKVPRLVSSYQGLSVCQERQFARAYGVPVHQMYSATELGGSQVAVTCRHGALHVRLDQVYLEIVRGGLAIEPGQLGQPVITSHHPSMPLVRYALSDLARFALEPCPCDVGSAWPTLHIEGRERDALLRHEAIVTPRQLDQSLRGLPIDLYRVVELQPGHFQVGVLPDLHEPLVLSEVEARLAALLRPEQLELRIVSRLPFEDSGKFRSVVPFTQPDARGVYNV